jgi:hypothetical protein
MSKVKLVVLSMLAMFALSAAASATTASAATHQWSINGTLLATGAKEEVQGNGLPYVQEGQFEATVGTINLHLYCQTAILPSGKENVLLGGNPGRANGRIEFTGCGVFAVSTKGVSEPFPSCKVETEPIVAISEGELTKSGVLRLTGIGGAGSVLTKFTIENTNKEAECLVKGKFEVKGTQVCVIPHSGVALYVHVVECTPGGSELKLLAVEKAEGEANFYLGAGVSLEKGGKFLSS